MKQQLLNTLVILTAVLSACSDSGDKQFKASDAPSSIQPLNPGTMPKDEYELPDEDIGYRNGRILFWHARRLQHASLEAFLKTSQWPTEHTNSTAELYDYLVKSGFLMRDAIPKEILQYITIARVKALDPGNTVFAVSNNYPGTGNSPFSSATSNHVFALSKEGVGGIFQDWSLPNSVSSFVLPPDSRDFLQ